MPGQDVRQLLLQVDASVALAQRNLSTLRSQVERDTTAMEGALQKPEDALGRYANAHGAVVHASGSARAAQMELMHVVRSSTDSFAAGQHVMTIFAMEVGRVAEAASFAGGSLGRFGAIMGGPWGIAISGGISLVTLLISHLLQAGESVDSLVEKKRHDARQSDLNAQADAIWRGTLEGLTATINEQNSALSQRLRLQAEVRDADLNQARQNIATGENRRNELLADRGAAGERVRTLERLAASPEVRADPNLHASTMGDLQTAREELARIVGELNQLNGTLQNAGDQLRNAEIERARALSTQEGRINDDYDRRQRLLEEHYRSHLITEDQLRTGEIALHTARQHALSAVRESERAERARAEAIRAGLVNSLYRPVPGSVLSPFGVHRAASGSLPAHDHAGVDLNAPFGSDVHAPFAGTARRRDNPTGLGWYVELRGESGLMARLAHLSGFNIPAGAGVAVERGQVVGYTGGGRPHPGAGNAAHTPSHLHYELWQNGHPINPVNGRGGQSVAEAQRAAEAARLRATHQDDQFAVELLRADERLLRARAELGDSSEQQVALALLRVRAEHDQVNLAIQNQVNEHKLTAAEAARLRALNEEATADEAAAIQERRRRELGDQAANIQIAGLRQQEQLLQGQQRLVTTAHDRLAIENRIIDLQEREERLQLEKVLAFGSGATPDQWNEAFARYQAMPQDFAQRRQAAANDNATPEARYLRELHSRVADVGTALGDLKVKAMQDLEQSTIDAALAVLHLHGALGNIVGDLLRIGLERELIMPLADRLFGPAQGGGGGGGIFGFLGQLLGAASQYVGSNGAITAPGSGNAPWYVGLPFGGRREGGGEVLPGHAYLVGERRPEIFMPRVAGTILPRVPQVRIPSAANLNAVVHQHNYFEGNLMTPEFWARIQSGDLTAAAYGAANGAAGALQTAARRASRQIPTGF